MNDTDKILAVAIKATKDFLIERNIKQTMKNLEDFIEPVPEGLIAESVFRIEYANEALK